MRNLLVATIAGFAGLVIAVSGARAAAFALLEQSAKGLGEAFAGGTTETDDPAAIFYNPAGIAFMERDAVSAGLSVVTIKMDFENQGSYTAAGTPLLGPDSTTDTMGYIPNAFAAFKVADNISAGIGITVPFGLSTRYDRGWVGRYHAVKSNLKSIDISPAVGWQIIPGLLSVGGAVNIQYLDATLTNSVDFGTILSGAGTIPQTLDGYADMNGDDWGIGYSLGACLLLTETTSVGINYRSKIDHTIDGDVDFTVPVQARAILDAIGMSNYFVNTGVEADLTTPASLSMGIAQMLGSSFKVMADLTWTGWSCFDQLAVEFDSGQPDSVTLERWSDTWRIALGVDWYLTQAVTLRAATSYDDSPVSKNYRTPRIPDNNRLWLALGVGIDITEDLTVDASYLHIFMKDMQSNLVNSQDAAKGFLIGEYQDPAIDVASLEFTYRF